MSYVRLGPLSDVYVYGNVAGGFTCCVCTLALSGNYTCGTRAEMIIHLIEHLKMGHTVPLAPFKRLLVEIEAEAENRVELEREDREREMGRGEPLD